MKSCWKCVHCKEDRHSYFPAIEYYCDLEKAEWYEEDDEGLICVDFIDEYDDFPPEEEVADYDV